MLDRIGHLSRRFFGSLSDAPPLASDEAWAEGFLLAGECRLWRSMSNADRRHSIVVARRFVADGDAPSRDETAGCLLHDVGKTESGLGTWARVAATVVGARGRRFSSYHDHERLGAELCRAAGSSEETILLVSGRGSSRDRLRRADTV